MNGTKINSYKDLQVWQKSMELVEGVYRLTKELPKEELYGLSSQMRRSAVAIPTNISEGYERNHLKEYIQFLFIAKASAAELETLFDICERLKFFIQPNSQKEYSLLREILRMLSTLTIKLRTRLQQDT